MRFGKHLYLHTLLVSCFTFCLLLPSQLFGQSYRLSNDIPVMVNGQNLRAAWAGGLSAPQFSPCDLNNDGTMDMVIFDRQDSSLIPMINKGTAGQVDYDYAPEFIDNFPAGMQGWMLCRDYDGDGYMDIFTARPGISNVRVFRNTSASTNNLLSFTVAEDTLISIYPPVLSMYVAKSDIPAIDDVDGDGDLDIVTFHLGGAYVEWHKNMSMENHGDLDHLEYQVASHCFGHFEEDANDCSAYIEQIPCDSGERVGPQVIDKPKPRDGVHAGSTMLTLDLTGDGVKELVVGDIGCRTLYALRNAGTTEIAHFDLVESNFPSQDIPVDVINFPGAFHMDVNNDGIRDLVTAPNAVGEIEDVSGVMMHLNHGPDTIPDFRFSQYAFLQEEMIETGTGSAPAFFDHNGDGLTDLLIANQGRFDSIGDFITYLQLFENTGTVQEPAFELVDADYINLFGDPDFQGVTRLIPAMNDLDGDGDTDMLLGNNDGTLFHFENTAGPGNNAAFTLTSSNYAGIDIGLNSAPELYDLDGDQDLDLLIGDHRGYIHYYENTGTPNAANFVLVTDTFGMVKLNNFTGQVFTNGQARPRLVDYDGDLQVELLVGGLEGQVEVYENVSLTPGASFTRVADLFGRDYGYFASLAATELDSSRLTFVVGGIRGGLVLMRGGFSVSAEAPIAGPAPELLLYPNPVRDLLHVRLQAQGKENGYVFRIVNALGQVMGQGELQVGEADIQTENFPAGVYFAVVTGKAGTVTKRFVVRR